MITLCQNKQLTPGDLGLNVRDEFGRLADPFAISFSIFAVGEGDVKSLISAPKMVPRRCSTGTYFVDITVPSNWKGHCELMWYVQLKEESAEDMIHEDFEVIDFNPLTSGMEAPSTLLAFKPELSPRLIEMIIATRELISDKAPSRDYHFRPPTPNKVVAGFTDRVGFIWTDTTIIRFLKLSVAQLNTWNPMTQTFYKVETLPPDWGQAAAVGAAAKCLSAEGCRFLADQFNFSLNGVSLDINKASEYQALASAYQQEFETWAPLLTASRPRCLGVRQNRWLI